MAENNFNKFTGKAKGTLIGNWEEERELKDFTGTSRSIPKQHVPKKHLDFNTPINNIFPNDVTHERIHGEKVQADFHSETWGIGKGKNKADTLPVRGKRTAELEREIQNKILQELK